PPDEPPPLLQPPPPPPPPQPDHGPPPSQIDRRPPRPYTRFRRARARATLRTMRNATMLKITLPCSTGARLAALVRPVPRYSPRAAAISAWTPAVSPPSKSPDRNRGTISFSMICLQ